MFLLIIQLVNDLCNMIWTHLMIQSVMWHKNTPLHLLQSRPHCNQTHPACNKTLQTVKYPHRPLPEFFPQCLELCQVESPHSLTLIGGVKMTFQSPPNHIHSCETHHEIPHPPTSTRVLRSDIRYDENEILACIPHNTRHTILRNRMRNELLRVTLIV